MANKWNKKYWGDLGERVGTTFGGALLGAITVTSSTPVDWSDGKVMWGILGVPTAVSLLKGLLANMKSGSGDAPSASVANVSSNAA